MGIFLKITRWVEEFQKPFWLKLGGHLPSKGIVKSGVPQGSVLGPLLFLIFINDLENKLTCNPVFFADDVKLIAPRGLQHEMRSSIEQAHSWSRRWDLPLNTSKNHYLPKGGHLDHRLVLTYLLTFRRDNWWTDDGLRTTFNPSANVLTATNKARGMLYFIKRSLICLTKEIFVPL